MPSDVLKVLRVLFIGDITGKYGRRFIRTVLPPVREKFAPDIVIANGENLAGGLGIIKATADEVFRSGVDFMTSGNHIWDKKEVLDLLKTEVRIIRPLNYHPGNPGKGFYNFIIDGDTQLLIINLQGRVFMEPVVDNPFTIVDDFLKSVDQKLILVDFHAEATAEKQSMGFFLEGRVSAVLGTHTHVQTSDLRILPGGTAFQSDVGMTGPLDSIIGMKKDPIIKKFLTGINQRFEVAKRDPIMDFTIVDIDKASGKALHAEFHRLFWNRWQEQLGILQHSDSVGDSKSDSDNDIDSSGQ
jgi:hypothetical protein